MPASSAPLRDQLCYGSFNESRRICIQKRYMVGDESAEVTPPAISAAGITAALALPNVVSICPPDFGYFCFPWPIRVLHG
jgi:hypothetical protein